MSVAIFLMIFGAWMHRVLSIVKVNILFLIRWAHRYPQLCWLLGLEWLTVKMGDVIRPVYLTSIWKEAVACRWRDLIVHASVGNHRRLFSDFCYIYSDCTNFYVTGNALGSFATDMNTWDWMGGLWLQRSLIVVTWPSPLLWHTGLEEHRQGLRVLEKQRPQKILLNPWHCFVSSLIVAMALITRFFHLILKPV